MPYVITLALLLVIVLLFTKFKLQHRKHHALRGEPLDISGWIKADEKVATEGGFALSGVAINYGNGRPYKRPLKKTLEGNDTWYAEFIDKGEWYKTDIGEKK